MICLECKRPFEPTALKQDVCIPCLLRPSHTLKVEGNMKNCKNCEKEYEPSGNNSKYCPACSIAKKSAVNDMDETVAPVTPPPVVDPIGITGKLELYYRLRSELKEELKRILETL